MRYTVGLISVLGLMFYGMFRPGKINDPPYLLVPGDDKFIHLILFGSSTLLFILAMVVDWGVPNSKVLKVASLFGMLFACSVEPLQYFVPFRIPDWFDLLSNVSGVLLGLAVYQWLLKGRSLPGYR